MLHTEVGVHGFRGHLNVFNHHDDILAGLLNRAVWAKKELVYMQHVFQMFHETLCPMHV